MKKLTNAENLENLQKRKFLRITSIIFAILTIMFAIFNLFYIEKKWLLALALLSALISTVLLNAREKIPINKVDDDVDETKISKIKEKKKVKTKKKTKK